MTLASGSRLGPYEILGPIGAGGMGEVYRAKDPRLGRDVAIKVLPSGVAADPERVRRFEREVRAASALNHPNIVTVHDVVETPVGLVLVMELVPGRTLREILAAGALAPSRMLPIAVQIADGLARAHVSGIVHRDLKPENVMVSDEGLVKVLDFGLAKASVTESSGVEASVAPTETLNTEPGVVMGTAGYMSPEQAAGRPLDFRSDQFSFGAILYEMATGRRAFLRPTAVETLSAIIRDDPEPIESLAPRVPAPLRWVAERCLAKEPRERYASTEDLARDLKTLRDRLPETTRSESTPVVAPQRRRVAPWFLAAAGAAAVVAAAVVLAGRSTPAAPSFRPLTFRRGAILNARFAPDGQTIAYSALWDGAPVEVFLARLDSLEARPIGVPESNLLAISPAGTMALTVGTRDYSGRFTGTLAEMPLSGGAAPRPIADNVFAADYPPAGQTVLIGRGRSFEMPPGKSFVARQGPLGLPRFSPDGQMLGFALTGVLSESGVAAVQGRDGKTLKVGEPWSTLDGLDWAPSGRELWVSGESAGRPRGIYAVGLSVPTRLVWRGPEALRLLEVDRTGRALVARDEQRIQAYAWRAGDAQEREVSWLDRSEIAALSPDGASILFTDRSSATEPGSSVYLRNLDGSLPARLGQGTARDLSRDGRLALVQRGTFEKPDLALVPTGAGEERTLDVGSLRVVDAKLLPDGKRILILGRDAADHEGHFVKDIEGGAARSITPGKGAHYRHALSNDGRWTVGLSFDDDQYYLYPTDADGGAPRLLHGIDKSELPFAFSADDTSVYVAAHWRIPPWKIYRLDLATGTRTPWREITPSDPAGVLDLLSLRVAPDGAAYSYSCLRRLSTLFLAEGFR